ncbi:hypothetical protein ACFQT0_18660 [Hymenobacter humi]|uniref:Uncharacterized protein n=1 Tax=Hymenobacter humi TaxID=1411620 RepID=A0ABW2UAN6_9BACT
MSSFEGERLLTAEGLGLATCTATDLAGGSTAAAAAGLLSRYWMATTPPPSAMW